MNVRTDRKTDRKTDRQTDKPHELHIYVGLAQARPNYVYIYTGTKQTFKTKYIIMQLYTYDQYHHLKCPEDRHTCTHMHLFPNKQAKFSLHLQKFLSSLLHQ